MSRAFTRIVLAGAVGLSGVSAQEPGLGALRIDAAHSPEPKEVAPIETGLPLKLKSGAHIAFIGNTLFDRAQDFGFFETLLYRAFPKHDLTVRTLAWSADEVDLMPRPANFGSLHQHLLAQKTDVIFAAYGFNESFAGVEAIGRFKARLVALLTVLRSRAYNGKTAPQIVLVSPIANEDLENVPAGKVNNMRIAAYTEAMQLVAAEQKVGFVDVFSPMLKTLGKERKQSLTFNGVHLLEAGYRLFASELFRGVFHRDPPVIREPLRAAVIEKNRQFHYRYRPINSFYYVGGRKGPYGNNDFLPAMRRFDAMLANRDRRVWAIAKGGKVPAEIDDSNVSPLPKAQRRRNVNRWMTPADELKAFKIDPRFQVNCFASEEDFPDLACPIQMRWDARGRLWVSCSTTYPHVYPGNAGVDKIIVLEDTDGDGRADKSSVFADDLGIPLSFEFGDGGLYVSEPPHLVFLADRDGDGRADFRRKVLTGFGTEDSHHSLHDLVWTPDGDLLGRDSIFLHSQVETPYGPVRMFDSGWFRFRPKTHRLQAFGTYRSTNPWGVTFDDWGQHVASHPIFASAFHATNPPYPTLHPRPAGIKAYSGTCGQEFVDMKSFPDELQGCFIKVRYKPTNRVEIHKWQERDDHYAEKYVGDILFSSNLSFIPVDVRFGPRGALYVLDWYNPVKGHAQYSLRDERRDRKSGRVWRITAKDRSLQQPPKIAAAPIDDLLRVLERREYRYRYWAKRELRDRDASAVKKALDAWLAGLDEKDPRFRHHQVEALWMYRNIQKVRADLLVELLRCEEHHARAAATRQLRYWHAWVPGAIDLLGAAAIDESGLVRLEAAIAASYIGSVVALRQVLVILDKPRGVHLDYALACALGSEALRRHWEGVEEFAAIPGFVAKFGKRQEFRETRSSAKNAQFDSQKNLKLVEISCVPEKMKFTVERIEVKSNQPVKLVFTNPDACDHNLVICRPGGALKVGMAASAMARDPKNARSAFIPAKEHKRIFRASAMIGPTRKSRIDVMRFRAPKKRGVYPYICTFPGHFAIMKGEMVVK